MPVTGGRYDSASYARIATVLKEHEGWKPYEEQKVCTKQCVRVLGILNGLARLPCYDKDRWRLLRWENLSMIKG